MLDLDAEVFGGFVDEVVGLVAEAAGGAAVARIADLGSGSGTGALALAERFRDADVIAVDAAEPLLAHLVGSARSRGVAGRIRPLHADLDDGWPRQLLDLDLVWASASLHHLADPPQALADVRSALVPGGLLVMVEMDDLRRFQPTFLPGDDTVESRAREVLVPVMTEAMPYLEADWGPLLAEAGFTVEVDRVVDLSLRPPLPAATGRYAASVLRRLREQLRDLDNEGLLSADDLAALVELTGEGPASVLHRDDLSPRSRRRVLVARRPRARL
jgi:SAM-dependent methyltransferase